METGREMARLFALVLFVSLVSQTSGAVAVEMTVPCQQNTVDGRILIDGRFLPDSVKGYRVKRYDPDIHKPPGKSPSDEDYPWGYGTCLIEISKGASG